MDEYISRKGLIDAFCNDENQMLNEFFPRDEAIGVVNGQPAADVVEARHGEWKPDLFYADGKPYRDEWYGYIFKCSVCGHGTMGGYELECNLNYCPYCGARMDGKDDAE